ncbi:MAG: alpha/beta hydrolase [Pseudomonadota bacterium]
MSGSPSSTPLQFFEFEGRQVAYLDSGSGAPLVFLHNGGISHRLFDHQVRHFEQTRRVIAMDWLGFGRSEKPRDADYGAPLYINQLRALLDHLELERVDLVGCCIGGSIAMLYAKAYPDRVASVTALSVATPLTTAGGALSPVLARRASLKYRILVAFGTSVVARALVWPIIQRKQLGDRVLTRDSEFVSHCKQNYQDPGVGFAFSAYDYYSHESLDRQTRPWNYPPLLVIWGRDNPVLSCRQGQILAQGWGAERTEVIDDCGYMVMREAPSRVNTMIKAHCRL